MRLDAAYTRQILNVFKNSPRQTTDVRELRDKGIHYSDSGFLFHMILLNDVGFIEREDGHPGVGVSRTPEGLYPWAEVPLRLTASGYEFAHALGSESGYCAVTTSTGRMSLRMMRDVAVKAFHSASHVESASS